MKTSKQTWYSLLLKDPRWQKKRLDILSRDDWACRECGNREKTLNVHHCYYIYGKKPWEYSDDSLITLCEPCHEVAPPAPLVPREIPDYINAATAELKVIRPALMELYQAALGNRPGMDRKQLANLMESVWCYSDATIDARDVFLRRFLPVFASQDENFMHC